MYRHHIYSSKGKDEPGKVDANNNPARVVSCTGKMNISLSPFAPENLVT